MTDATPAKPNIILILNDDMGYSDIGCYGGEIATPNLDKLAAAGMRFTQCYSNAKCSPSRATILTGLYRERMGMEDMVRIHDKCLTIGEVLRPAGYHTITSGKWHNMMNPVKRGFDRYFGLNDGFVGNRGLGHLQRKHVYHLHLDRMRRAHGIARYVIAEHDHDHQSDSVNENGNWEPTAQHH